MKTSEVSFRPEGGRLAAQVQELLDDLAATHVPLQPAAGAGAEIAAHGAADLRGNAAHGPARPEGGHEDGFDRPAGGKAKQQFDRSVGGDTPVQQTRSGGFQLLAEPVP